MYELTNFYDFNLFMYITLPFLFSQLQYTCTETVLYTPGILLTGPSIPLPVSMLQDFSIQ